MIQYIVIEVVNCTLQFPCRFNGHNNDVRLYMHVGYNFKTHLIRQTQWFQPYRQYECTSKKPNRAHK